MFKTLFSSTFVCGCKILPNQNQQSKKKKNAKKFDQNQEKCIENPIFL